MFPGLSNLLRFGGFNLPMSQSAQGQPAQAMPVRMPLQHQSAFNLQPLGGIQPFWGSIPPMFNSAGFNRQSLGPMQHFPQFNSQLNFGAQSQMRPARPGY